LPLQQRTLSIPLGTTIADAVKKEVDYYSRIVGRRPVTSFYIGGGTPTTMLHNGLADMVGHIHDVFDVRCDKITWAVLDSGIPLG
jgi:coproporphyrinogen III oxidase-like Fe-S oxidoreductase